MRRRNRLYVAVRTTVILLLCSVVCALLLGGTPVAAYLCQLSNVSVNYQQPAMPSQSVHLLTNVSGICDPAEEQVYYSVRVDVHDATSNQVLSMNSAPIGYLTLERPSFAVTVPNTVTAPNTIVAWQLTVVVYVFANYEFVYNGIDGYVVDAVTVQVGTSETTTTTYIQTSAATVTTTISTTSAFAGSSASTAQTQLEDGTQQNQNLSLLSVAALSVLTVAVIALRRKRQRAQRSVSV